MLTRKIVMMVLMIACSLQSLQAMEDSSQKRGLWGSLTFRLKRQAKTTLTDTPDKEVQLKINNLLLQAAQTGSKAEVKAALDATAVQANREVTDHQGNSAFHLAALNNHKDVLEVLLNAHPLGIFLRNHAGQTPLHLAADRGSLKALRFLLDAPNIAIDYIDAEKNTALHMAAQGGRPLTVRALLNAGAEPMILNAAGQTALHLAVFVEPQVTRVSESVLKRRMGNRVKILHRLLKANPHLINVADAAGNTPLHTAIMTNQYCLFNSLLQYASPDLLNQPNKAGQTPRDLAAGAEGNVTLMLSAIETALSIPLSERSSQRKKAKIRPSLGYHIITADTPAIEKEVEDDESEYDANVDSIIEDTLPAIHKVASAEEAVDQIGTTPSATKDNNDKVTTPPVLGISGASAGDWKPTGTLHDNFYDKFGPRADGYLPKRMNEIKSLKNHVAQQDLPDQQEPVDGPFRKSVWLKRLAVGIFGSIALERAYNYFSGKSEKRRIPAAP